MLILEEKKTKCSLKLKFNLISLPIWNGLLTFDCSIFEGLSNSVSFDGVLQTDERVLADWKPLNRVWFVIGDGVAVLFSLFISPPFRIEKIHF